ncbi:hypothetical protein ACFX19_016614 [Malus domestica]
MAKKGKAPEVGSLSPSMAQSLSATHPNFQVDIRPEYLTLLSLQSDGRDTTGFILKPLLISINGYKPITSSVIQLVGKQLQ